MDHKGKMFTGEEAFAKMARICSQKECAPFDIARKLRKLELPEPLVYKVIDRLKKEKYIDEERFIRSFIHDKIHFHRWGRRKIELFLKHKELPQKLVDEVFWEFTDNDSFSKPLQELLTKRWIFVKGRSDFEKKGKLIRFALGKGYTIDEVMATMEKIQAALTVDETDFDEMG